jgi:hypothetical protein
MWSLSEGRSPVTDNESLRGLTTAITSYAIRVATKEDTSRRGVVIRMLWQGIASRRCSKGRERRVPPRPYHKDRRRRKAVMGQTVGLPGSAPLLSCMGGLAPD